MFNKNKDLILRIMNGIFILWLVIALVLAVNSGMMLIFKNDKLSYSNFKDLGCREYPHYEKIEIELTDEQCKMEYKVYEKNYNEILRNDKINFYTTIFQLIFVSSTLFVINRKNK